MNKLFTSILAFIMALSVWAEAPQTISYQAVVRNNVGRLLREHPVGVRITILSGSENGQVVYSETRTTTTNNNGLLTFAIGDANGVTTDDLSKIAWADNTYFLRCEMDPDGGNTYTLSSTSQMNSVPYALYAKNIAPEALPSWTQSEEKPVYNYTEIVGAPSVPTKVSELQNDANYITLQQVPTVVVPTKVSELQNDANYLTEHQSLADYAKKSELPSTEGLLSAADAAATYQPKGEYLTEHQSLTDYVKKSELPAVPTKVSELTNDAGYITEANVTTTLNTINVSELVNDANYATTADVPTKVSQLTNDKGYITAAEVPAVSVPTKVSAFENDANYLTEHQSLAEYAKKSELPSVPTKVSELTNDANYVTEGNITTVLNTTNVSELVNDANYATTADVPTKVSQLTNDKGYITAAEVPAVSVPTKVSAFENDANYLTEHQSLADYAKKSELPSTAGLLSEADAAATYQPKGEYLTEHQSLADYAKKSDLPTVPTKVSELTNDANYVTEGNITTVLNTTNVSELVNDANYATTADVPTKVSQLTNDKGYITAAEVPTVSVPTKVSAFENDKNYLTEHQSLADYVKKSELPTVPTKVSELTNDAGYITLDEVPANPTKVSELTNDAGYITSADVPTKVSELTNDEGFITTSDLPTNVSELTNDANYITLADVPAVPTKVSAFENDANYLTEHQSLTDYAKKSEVPTIPTKVSTFENDAQYITKAAFDSVVNSYNALLEKYAKQLDSLGNVINASQRTVPIEKGALPGLFSVSADKQVKFSMGNLQYQASESKWRFAEQQYDIIGGNNKNISSTYSGWIDLFGWGTSGWNSGAKAYQPYSTNEASSDYLPGGDSSNDLTGAYANADWGVYNAISNGGNQAGQWRTMTNAEWVYLYSGRANAKKLRALATVNEMKGYIFLPDEWQLPDGLSFMEDAKNFSSNKYTLTHWMKLEAAGAVFLPVAGYRSGKTINSLDTYGHYYSVTHKSENQVYYFSFSAEEINPSAYYGRSTGHSVRLVQDVKSTYTVSLSVSPSEGGTISGAGTYDEGASVAITATPASGYTFQSWSDGNTEANRTITVTENISLTATFVKKSQGIATDGALPGEFSVSATKKVKFSKGNLQYQASTDTWRFAENQYDVIGDDNKNISAKYSGWIDLFGWGTSGYHNSNDEYNTNYAPYSKSNKQVNTSYNFWGYGPSSNKSLTGDNANYDWGVFNVISNGGDLASAWRTLTDEEFGYLWERRKNASALRGYAEVNGINGFVILPDNWIQPVNVSFVTTLSSYADNIFSKEQWIAMDSAGAVFFPAAGVRSVTVVSGVGSKGFYWSSTVNSNDQSLCWGFDAASIFKKTEVRYCGCSVRLVSELDSSVEGIKYKLQLNSNPVVGGEISGTGLYDDGEVVTIKAVAADGFTFEHWSDGNTSSSRVLTMSSNMILTAFFKSVTDGVLPGVFSVSADKQVKFSKGNLQYQESSGEWAFAKAQYDLVGGDNKNISSTYDGWVDLFGWGTSGYNNKYPYITSTDSENYGDGKNDIAGTNYDWGVYNAISNGGNKVGLWRTLTQDEWLYLCKSRNNASELRGQASINGVNGYVFLPDDWIQPLGVTFVPLSSDYGVNMYDIDQWNLMEKGGAVFLPAGGFRKGTSVSYVGSLGYYWSSSWHSGNCCAYDFSFGEDYVSPSSGYNSRYGGHCVRLVQDN